MLDVCLVYNQMSCTFQQNIYIFIAVPHIIESIECIYGIISSLIFPCSCIFFFIFSVVVAVDFRAFKLLFLVEWNKRFSFLLIFFFQFFVVFCLVSFCWLYSNEFFIVIFVVIVGLLNKKKAASSVLWIWWTESMIMRSTMLNCMASLSFMMR